MSNLAITEIKEKKMDVLEDLALEIVRRALVGELPADEDQVKLAGRTMSVTAKNRQTLNHSEHFRFGVASMVAQTDAEIRNYALATNPQMKNLLKGK